LSEVDLGGVAGAWLLAAGVLSGAASIWAFQRWSDTEQLRVSTNSVMAHLMEFRLFAQEPSLIVRAQWNLLRANAGMLRALLGPSLLLVLPFVVLLGVLDGFFGYAALSAGEIAIVTVQASGPLHDAILQTPDGVTVETPAVRALAEHQISWRIRPGRAVSGLMQITANGAVMQKSIRTGAGLHWIAAQRSGSLVGFFLHPQEWPLFHQKVSWVRVQYPVAAVFGFHWLVSYSIAACVGALLTLWRVS
jgi:hypothetical protein